MLVKIIATMLKNTYTTDDFVERIGLMRLYFGKRLFAGGEGVTLQEVLGGECEEHTLKVLESWMEEFKSNAISPLLVYEALDTIEEDLTGMPSVLLYVPVHFSYEHVERFGLWFREHVQPNILLTLRTDPRMAGGCGVVWKSILHDLSLRYFITKNRAALLGTFDTHIHATK